MGPSVTIKTNAYGLIIRLDPELSFDVLLQEVGKKFREAARFFRNAQMAVTFKGRSLTEEEEYELISVITASAQLQIVCVVDESEDNAAYYQKAAERALRRQKDQALIHRHTVASGETLQCDTDLVILGDVNPGATVITKGDLIVMGCVMGNITVGSGGRKDAFAAALILKPSLLRIADKAARSAITKRIDTGEYAVEPRIAYIRDDHISLEKLKGSIFKQISAQLQKE